MTSEAIIAILRAHEAPLRSQGVRRAALFGSTARGEASSDSDLDILIEIDPTAHIDLYDYVGITHYISELFTVPVDIADHAMLIEPVRRTAERDAVYAF